MTEQIQDQMSAFVDDELTSGECAFLVRRLERDPEARGKLIRYATIGSALRGELLAPEPGILLRRVRQAIAGVTEKPAAVRAAADAPQKSSRQLRPAIAAGVAAGVALAVVLILYAGRDGSVPDGAALQASTAGQPGGPQTAPPAAPSAQRPSYEVAQNAPGARQPIRLTNYLVHHGKYASGVSRTSVHSNVIGSQEVRDADGEPVAWE